MFAAECIQHCSNLEAYKGLMTDVPHILFEFTLEILTAPVAYFIGKLVVRREHKVIDAEHGVTHEPR